MQVFRHCISDKVKTIKFKEGIYIMPVVQDYLARIQNLLAQVSGETDAMETASDLIAEAYSSGHTIYVFGCTHSAILAEDRKSVV